MKLAALLATPLEVVDFVGTRWQTQEMRDSHNDPNGYVRKIVEEFARLPRIFTTMDVPEIESSNFTTWMNAISIRNYDSPGISDVYYLHEITHAARMIYDPTLAWNRWYEKMAKNEYYTSLETEVYVYLALPTLRAKTFQFEIWADRFLNDPQIHEYLTADDRFIGMEHPARWQSVRYNIAEQRKAAMQSPDPFDFLELQIANYLEQNLDWARIWRKNYNEIEQYMLDFKTQVDATNAAFYRNQEDLDSSLRMDLEDHWSWLTGQLWSEKSGATYAYPFPDEANAFAEVYKTNKKKFGNENL
jgi:hypothetical protein